ncbi:hypothetical protein A5784_18340 [Mycobacterium sp. 852013-50091_SCH5140682]|uniref:hypothetical protein n=1 Tax=Mycobacterium sp. 852013-50091_SCH5140682 TaxID=1834109 RepID=UPI0007EAD8FB|nr:hypothetical protein [Mycobacterium sp. 852013-50091_SCH5140682]OBC01664.1 hypothetical protein A5784_18340 [Mycobacterium sp. 852013-50091_SCH5140682]
MPFIAVAHRQLTMLRNAGHFDGIADNHRAAAGSPAAVRCSDSGLPLGHGDRPETVPLGAMAVLDTRTGTLVIE